MASSEPVKNPKSTTRLTRRAYASQATPTATASSDVAKTGPGTLPTYRRTGSTDADAGLKNWYQVPSGSPNGAPLAGLMYLNGAPRVTRAMPAYAIKPAWARIAGRKRARSSSSTTASAATATETSRSAPAPTSATPKIGARSGLAP